MYVKSLLPGLCVWQMLEPRCGCFVLELPFVRMTDRVRGDDVGGCYSDPPILDILRALEQ